MAVEEVSEGFRYAGLSAYTAALEAWIYPELRAAAQLPARGEEHLLLGTLVYGDYVDRFLELCIPSLLAPGNLKALNDPLFVIHTDAKSRERIREALEPLARTEVYVVPEEVLKRVAEHAPNKYWLLGASNYLHMYIARWRGYGYHLLMPDHIYAGGFFRQLERLRRRGEQAIVRGGLSAKLEEVRPLLLERRCVFSAEDLNALAMSHLHPQFEALLLNGRKDYPISSLVVLVVDGAAVVVSPHASPVYMSNDLLYRTSLRLFNTIDGQLPYIIPEYVQPYFPKPGDGMSYIEVSDSRKPSNPPGRGHSAIEFASQYWLLTYADKAYLRYLHAPTVMSFPKGYVPPVKPMDEGEFRYRLMEMWDTINSLYEPMTSVYRERVKHQNAEFAQ